MIFLVRANAPITPSNEKLASNISRYINVPNHHANRPVFTVVFSFSWRYLLSDETIRYVMRPAIPAVRKLGISDVGNHEIFVVMRRRINATIISIDSNFPRRLSCLSIIFIRCISFASSKKKDKNTINKNVHPNHASGM